MMGDVTYDLCSLCTHIHVLVVCRSHNRLPVGRYELDGAVYIYTMPDWMGSPS
jgi:galactose mutarotase-like enzyme